jgi:hypothetical protein
MAASALKTAFRGLGTDEAAVINTLGQLNAEQRVLVAHTFKRMYGEDLVKELKSELSGNFEDVCVMCIKTRAELDATILKKAMKGIGTDEEALIEVLCTRSNEEIKHITACYKLLYGEDLQKEIADETSGLLQKFLVGLVQGVRSEAPANPQLAQSQAHALYQAGEGRWGTDESVFQQILVTSSVAQLRNIGAFYQQEAGKPLEFAIESEFSGEIKKAYLAIVKSACNTHAYFAERLYLQAMKGLGTDDAALIRLIVTRADRDLTDVKACFHAMYGKTLGMWIRDECSGDYKKMLLVLANEP